MICCGANPGMVSWFVKQALLDVAAEVGLKVEEPQDPRRLGAADATRRRQGHPHRRARHPARARRQSRAACSSTPGRSKGFCSEGLQPAELGWGTHEKMMPANAAPARLRLRCRDLSDPAGRRHAGAVVDADRAGAARLHDHPQRDRSRSRTISRCARTATSSTGRPATTPITRATTRCCRCTRWSGAAWQPQPEWQILDEHEIVDGIDELGVLLYGHAQECLLVRLAALGRGDARSSRRIRTPPALQVTSAVLAGMVWALENPDRGIVEADEMDFRRCLEIQRPYLGPVIGRLHRLDAARRPRRTVPGETSISDDPWQFSNVLVR